MLLCIKTDVHLRWHLAQFLLEQLFQTDVAEKIKNTYFMFNNFSQNRVVYDTKVKVKQSRYRPGGALRVPRS